MTDKIRLDSRIVQLGLLESREKAKAMIMAGQVYVNGQKELKAGTNVVPGDNIEVRGSMEFVSRGGYKLKKAMEVFPINLENKICMDIGASTGGFSDCMLKNEAAKVYCVDVGYGQLAWKIRSDERVVNMERTNIRYVTREQVADEIDFASVDVSFISLSLVLPAAYDLLAENGEMVCLIKPQFEAGRENVGKKGVVRDSAVHADVIEKVCAVAQDDGFGVLGLDYSPIKGPEGNIEFLLYIRKNAQSVEVDVQKTVAAAHAALNGGEQI